MRQADVGKLTMLASLALFFVLAVLFLAYFIITNNSYFILYSFPLFVIFGIVASASKRLTEYEVIAALSFIIVGSIMYFLGFWKNANFSINTAIVGYYLLISAVISIFISIAAEDSKRYHKFEKFLSRLSKDRRIQYVAIAVFVLLLVLPIWPTGQSLSFGRIPNAQIIINNSLLEPVTNSSDFNYSVIIPYQKYQNYTTYNLSNIQFYYSSGQKINATLHQINDTYNYSADLLLNYSKINKGYKVYLYFMPYNFSNYSIHMGLPISNTTFAAKDSIRGISYVGSHINRHVRESLSKRIQSSKSIIQYAYPYYQLGSYCAPGYNITYNVSFSFNNTASFFELRNASDFLDSINNASVNDYPGYLKGFSRYSFARFFNVSKVQNRYYSNNSCLFYVIVSNNALKANGIVRTFSNKVIGHKNITIKVPNLYMNISRYISNTYSFVWKGVSYVDSEYANYSLNKSN